MMTNRPSVFISYAHKDGMEFVRRVAFALEMYMDVYWDRRLQAGEYPAQLFDEIEARDYFLFVMTPYSLASAWCRKELTRAQECAKQIALARVYEGEGTTDPELDSKYTYGDFTEDYEAGFRRLAVMMLGQPYSSWEYLSLASTSILLNYLKYGGIPCLISKQIAEWVIVEKLWCLIEDYISRRKGFSIIYGQPRTPSGMLQLCPTLMEQFAREIDGIGTHHINEVKPILETFISELMLLGDNNHQVAGNVAANLIDTVKHILLSDTSARMEVSLFAQIKGFFDFEVAEKLREYINDHARRSRYLY